MTEQPPRRRGRVRSHETPSASLLLSLGYTEDKTRYWLGLGTALEALVRALAQRAPLAQGLCRRVHSLWAAQGGVPIEFDATELTIEGEVALLADSERGRFILPAYQAGLRAIRMLPHATPDDLIRVGEELKALAADEQGELAFARFREWLWSDDAEGFELELGPAHDEHIATVITDAEALSEHYVQRSQQAVAAWNQRALAAAQELDVETISMTYQEPIAHLQECIRDPRSRLSDEEMHALHDAAEDAVSWARVEAEAMLTRPELLNYVSADRLVGRVVSLLRSAPSVDDSMLLLLRRLGDQGSDAGSRALNSRRVGRAIAAHVGFDDFSLSELSSFLADLDRHARAGAATELLARGTADERAWVVLALILQRWPIAAFVDAVDLRRVEPGVAVGFYRVAACTGVEARILAELAAHLPPSVAAEVLVQFTPVRQLSGALQDRLLARHASHCLPLVRHLLAEEEGGVRIGEALLHAGAQGWSASVCTVVFQGLVRRGLGERYVVPLARSRTTPADARLAALESLRDEPRLLGYVLERSSQEPPSRKELQTYVERMRGDEGMRDDEVSS